MRERGRRVAGGRAAVRPGPFPLDVRLERAHLQVSTDGTVVLDLPHVDVPSSSPRVGRQGGIRPLPPHLLVCPALR
jgi:hypothetical protein